MVSTSTGCLLNLGCGSLGRQRKVLDESSRETNSIKKILNFFKKLRRLGRQGKKKLYNTFTFIVLRSDRAQLANCYNTQTWQTKNAYENPSSRRIFKKNIFFFVHQISLGTYILYIVYASSFGCSMRQHCSHLDTTTIMEDTSKNHIDTRV